MVRNAVELTLEYSRPLRSLKLWLAFRTHGAAAFRELDRAARWRWHVGSPTCCAPTPSSSCCASRPCRPFASATRRRASSDLDAHNTALAAAAQRTGGSTSPPRSSTGASACGPASSTSAPAPRTSTSRSRRCASSAAERAQAGVSRNGIRLMPLKKFDCRRSGSPVSSKLGDPPDHLLEHDLDLEPGEVGAGAEVRAAGAEGHLRVRVAADVERVRVVEDLLVEVARDVPGGELVVLRLICLPPNSTSVVAVRRKWCTGVAQRRISSAASGISSGSRAAAAAARGSRSAPGRPGRSSGGWSRCRRPRAAGSRRRTRAGSAGSRRSRPRPAS